MSGLVFFFDATEVAVKVVKATFNDAFYVGSQVPNPRPDLFVVIRRVGGVRQNILADEANLIVEAWADTESRANDLAQSCRAAIHAAKGTQVEVSGPLGEVFVTTIYRTGEVAGPAVLPDPDSKQARYTLTVSMAVRGKQF